MARGVNKVILVGNLGADPEVRYTSSGSPIANLRLATSEAWKDKQTGEHQERTEWHRVVFFGRLAEIVAEYLKKGGKIYIEGSLRTSKWQDKAGQDRYTTEIIASEMQMLDSRHQGGGSFAQEFPPASAMESRFEPASAHTVTSAGAPRLEPTTASATDFDEDVPF